MRRTSIMTLGLVLIFVGIQLNLVETYVLTPRFSNFLTEHADPQDSESSGLSLSHNVNNGASNSPYYQASYPGANSQQMQKVGSALGGPKSVSTPSWLCWPILFLGTVVFLHGLSIRGE